jgi:hypothetical protein
MFKICWQLKKKRKKGKKGEKNKFFVVLRNRLRGFYQSNAHYSKQLSNSCKGNSKSKKKHHRIVEAEQSVNNVRLICRIDDEVSFRCSKLFSIY